MYYLYGLTDPRTKKIRYIGMSKRPFARFNEHIYTKTNYKKDGWINDLKRDGMLPKMIMIDCGSKSRIVYLEKLLIKNTGLLLNMKHKPKKVLLSMGSEHCCAAITWKNYQCLRTIPQNEKYCYQHK